MQITVQGRIFPSKIEARQLDELMQLQSSCMRYSYQRICEGRSKSEIEADIKEKFSGINSRYRCCGYFRAKATHDSVRELVKMGELDSPKKVVFGGRENLKKREKGKLSNREWKELRNNQLYSRGDKSKNGNMNLRFVERDGELHLRVNVGDREWIHVPAYLPCEKWKFLAADESYGVKIIRRNDEYELRVSFEEGQEPQIGFEKGAIGIDFNHDSIDLAVTNEQGQLKDNRAINCFALTSARRGKRDWMIGNLVKEVVDYAKYWHRGLAIERLKEVTKGKSNQHEFTYKKFLEAIKRRAEREGVIVKKVNPAYTSIIGKHKYLPYYHLTVHQAAALVIARRGQGFSEHLHKLKSTIFKPLEGGEGVESMPSRRVHSWSLWRLTKSLGSRKGGNRKRLGQSPETIGVESPGTIGSTEKSLTTGDVVGAETASPGIGPPKGRENNPYQEV